MPGDPMIADWEAECAPLAQRLTLLEIARRVSGQAYLATPYTIWAETGMDVQAAAYRAEQWLGFLTLAGISAVSPIVQSHRACLATPELDNLDGDFWNRINGPLMAASSCMIVPPIPLWHLSRGIAYEARAFVAQNKPVYLISEAGGGV